MKTANGTLRNRIPIIRKWGVRALLPLSLLVIFIQGEVSNRRDLLESRAHADDSDHGHSHAQSGTKSTPRSADGAVHVGLRTQSALGIVTQPAARQDLLLTLDVNGSVRARPQDVHDIHSPVEGTVVELHAFPGDRVAVGDPLLTLQVLKILDWQEAILLGHAEQVDHSAAIPLLQAEGEARMLEFLGELQGKSAETEHFQEELDILRSAGAGAVSRQEIHHKEGQLKTSRADLLAKRALALAYGLDTERIARLESTLETPENPGGVIAPEYRTLIREKQFSLEMRKVQVETAKANLRAVGFSEERIARLVNGEFDQLTDRLEFRATSDGWVVESEVSLQQAVTPADHLFRIVDYSTVFIDAEIPEMDIGKAVDRIDAPMPVRALGFGGRALEAKFEFLDTRVDRFRRTARLVASLENLPGQPLRDGMAVTLGAAVGFAEDALVVPNTAVLRQGLESIVFVRDPKHAADFIRKPVRTGLSNIERTEIVGGLEPGEDVVVEGAFHLLLAHQQAEGEGKEMDHGHAHH